MVVSVVGDVGSLDEVEPVVVLPLVPPAVVVLPLDEVEPVVVPPLVPVTGVVLPPVPAVDVVIPPVPPSTGVVLPPVSVTGVVLGLVVLPLVLCCRKTLWSACEPSSA